MVATMDLLLTNGRIYTVDPDFSIASAVGITGSRIVFVGTEAESSRRAGSARRIIDLKGLPVYPGFIDSHFHLAPFARSLDSISLRDAMSFDEVGKAVAERAKNVPPGNWIVGTVWDQMRRPTESIPAHRALAQAAPNHPVILFSRDGHVALMNHAALKAQELTADAPDPPGGRYQRNGSGGELTGVLFDSAALNAWHRIAPPQAERYRRLVADSFAKLNRLGITCIHDAGTTEDELAMYREMVASPNAFPMRVYCMIDNDRTSPEPYFAEGPRNWGPDLLFLRAVKLYADGALGSRGAALFEDYADDPGNRGAVTMSGEAIRRTAAAAILSGFQPATHAIGDRSVRAVLDAYKEASSRCPHPEDLRFRIEHIQVVRPDDVSRPAECGVIASIQPIHCTEDMDWMEKRLGPERVRRAYPWRDLVRHGAKIVAGSDAPVADPNPIAGFHAAVTRQRGNGEPAGGWHPEQSLTRREILEAYTINGAYAGFMDDLTGSIEAGKKADLTVLSQDIMEAPADRILSAHALMTIFDGKIVYEDSRDRLG